MRQAFAAVEAGLFETVLVVGAEKMNYPERSEAMFEAFKGSWDRQLADQMIQWWGPIVTEYYVGTETGPLTLATGTDWLAHPGTCDRPITGARIHIVDAAGNEARIGKAGEIFGRLDPYPDFEYHNDPSKREEVGCGEPFLWVTSAIVTTTAISISAIAPAP